MGETIKAQAQFDKIHRINFYQHNQTDCTALEFEEVEQGIQALKSQRLFRYNTNSDRMAVSD